MRASLGIAAAVVAAGSLLLSAPARKPATPFAKNNLVAWCIVPFDAKHRGPAERAEMLKRLGITKIAYDWRDKDIPSFDEELDQLTKNGIRMHAFWLVSSLDPANDKNVATVLGFLGRRKVRAELWTMLSLPKDFAALSQDEKVNRTAAAVKQLAAQTGKIGCSVGLYNHGGWFGEPENQIAIIRRAGARNVGIVYNFHHGHEQIDRFPQLFKAMQPYLMAVNLNGMRREGPMILTIGQGDRELEMIRLVRASGYRGPVGILNHREDTDAEQGLKGNMEGLRELLGKLGDTAALKTY